MLVNKNIVKDKLEVIQWITTLEDETLIEKLKLLMENASKKTDWWEQISETEKNAIDEGIEEVKAGKIVPQEEVKKIYEKWL
jgi:predicted transcriptional regulator